MLDVIEQALEAALIHHDRIGQIVIRRNEGGFVLTHRDDEGRDDLHGFQNAGDAVGIAKFDDAGNFRPLKTAPNLRHGWRLNLTSIKELRIALDYLCPGRLATLAAWKAERLVTTPLRETLSRQSGMYRIAAEISDRQIDQLVGNFCRSDGGCLRTILWKRDRNGTVPSAKLPPSKYDPQHDQIGRGESAIPLLCQEACNLLIAEARETVRNARAVSR